MTRRNIEAGIALYAGIVLGTTGCSDEGSRVAGADGPGLTGLTGTETETDGRTTGGSTAAGDDGNPGSADGAPLFDVGSGEGGDGRTSEERCQAVDFLFVIDNSVSMSSEQAALVGAFPGFMAAIDEALEIDGDYHILVTDTDEWGRCNTANPWDGMDPDSNTCNDYIETTVFQECDRTLGAGVVHPAGKSATNAPCAFRGGNRYITTGEPDLAGTFSCAATVGVAGHPQERAMDSMIAALQPTMNGPGGCNEGFLRPDAPLVIAFVTDEKSNPNADGPDQWYEAVVNAKGGDPSAVVVLGLTNGNACFDGNPRNPPDLEPTEFIEFIEFIEKFGDRGLRGLVCGTAEDYVSFFEMAVGTIEQACNEFVPPG